MSENQKAQQPNDNQKLDMMKQSCMMSVNHVYTPMKQFINKLPINPVLRDRVYSHLDSGILWLQEAIRLIDVSVVQSQEEKINAAQEGKEPEGNQPEHQDGKGSGEACSPSDSNSPAESGQEQEEKETDKQC